MTTPLIVIPSRLDAQRFNRKPLALIHGKPMILRVWEQAIKADIGPVVVACCSNEIKDLIEAAGGIAVITPPELPSGTDRVHAGADVYDPQKKHGVVINLQGDLPAIHPDDVKKVLKALVGQKMDISTLASPIHTEEERTSPNVVKAIIGNLKDDMGQAFYFTRQPVSSGHNKMYHHVGIYAFNRDVLADFVSRPPSPLEKQESLEQLRALEAGYTFGIHLTDSTVFGVDHPSDIQKTEDLLRRLNWS
ncbi:MAG: 3-deoxy-manno-octulosonate cytidylyltransferase [Alphaproteobacteria bacterium RIFCSPLOWO2_01_FULL_45_8]|nr:MAG: 3-deoxy-manno-octulosonate cytidylyltransferase [Alphaproteobacteria bacterium GWB1_45_5]OFW75864.1 MAG: 3-deoxy-manno-octulosonate cytidylyltransferase [Alphaproteobacteria bacterium GWA1_45_9]OFW89953.1 MAG: 3-deoxy-manno-octulosonate cytidylyltransferase [Alphaproteobacteria bacterium RIFCSPHIGHO2_01_FULL_41_14]OFW96645.1 MAG: 3-deoxy-manno-octulosonate cytidylyltransferase [Alphaproteobacteria bacterium RIFCSPLOWO2_01_FULL_45_8]